MFASDDCVSSYCLPGHRNDDWKSTPRKLAEMARWPDNWKSNLIGFLIVFVLTPVLFYLAWWWMN